LQLRSSRDVKRELRKAADPEKAAVLRRFFKTGPGQYGQGDVFLGVTVPQSRAIAKKYAEIALPEIKTLLSSEIHEERLVALLLLVQNKGAEGKEQEQIAKFYLDNIRQVNNWDLVDLSAPRILGPFNDRPLLYKLAKSDNIWERRIAIVATLHFIRQGDFGDTLKIAEMLLHDKHDLIHKAAGWMLREVGKKDAMALEQFLDSHYASMPRTMLRYAIERLPAEKRLRYMKKHE
jgi:3-methyladenine DNA glycosylase AlkD